MKAEPSAQLRLLDLQRVDSELAQHRHRRAGLPEHAEIARLLGERKKLLESYTVAETAVSDLEREQAKAEADLEPVRARRQRNQQRVDSGAADAKALSSLIEEIAHLDKRISDLEDAELEVMEALEQKREELGQLTTLRSELEQKIRTLMAERDRQTGEIDERIAELDTERGGLAGALPDALLTSYHKVAATHGGSGAAELKQGRCLGCRLEVNAADLRAYAAAAPDEVLRCEECGRILVRTANSGL